MHIKQLSVGPMASNTYIVWRDHGEDALIIDAGDDAERILAACEEENLTPIAVLLTHGHFDHILAAPEIRQKTGAIIAIHEADAGYLADSSLNLYQPALANSAYAPFRADETLTDGALELGGFRLQLIHTPGHTPGGLCYYFPEENTLFTGDTLFDGGVGRTDFPGGDERALAASVMGLLALPPETLFYPGHDGASTIERARRVFA